MTPDLENGTKEISDSTGLDRKMSIMLSPEQFEKL